MKTPMQELIEKLEKKYKEYISHKGNDEWYASVAYGIEISIRHAKSMVDVEKDLIQNVFQEGQEFPPLIHGKDNYSWLNFYNETYGGKK
jgi:hypothetical protein